MDDTQLVTRIIEIAQRASDAILKIYHNVNIEVSIKSDNSPLTSADLASDSVIKAGLRELDLGYPVLTEETAEMAYQKRKEWKRFWLVDPLDGTKEFIKRNGEFTINIALIENNTPILGVVHVPVLDTCYYGTASAGAYVRKGSELDKQIKVRQLCPNESVLVVTSRSHADQRTEALLEFLGRHECISMGSSLKLCAVAEGSAHFYPRLGPTMEWDTAAAHAIVSAAGGRVCDITGVELSYNKPDLHNPEFFVLPKNDDFLLKVAKQCLNVGVPHE